MRTQKEVEEHLSGRKAYFNTYLRKIRGTDPDIFPETMEIYVSLADAVSIEIAVLQWVLEEV